MNYLAHAYLSFGDPQVVTGNLISDFVKGRKKYDYPPRILAGIELHRAIDSYTDTHPINKEISAIFRPVYGLYSSAFVDIVYDHFVALEIATNGDAHLLNFSEEVYSSVDKYVHMLPDSFNNIFPFMKEYNWLYNYQYGWGIEKSIAGLVHRAKYMSDSKSAFRLFENKYDEFKRAYEAFFPGLRAFSLEKFSDIH